MSLPKNKIKNGACILLKKITCDKKIVGGSKFILGQPEGATGIHESEGNAGRQKIFQEDQFFFR